MARAAARDQLTDTAAAAAIDQACRILRLPTIRERHAEIAAAASREQASYKGFLVELLCTIAYNAVTGARIWLRFYDGPAKAADGAIAAAVGPKAGRVFVTGHSQGPDPGPDYATVAYGG